MRPNVLADADISRYFLLKQQIGNRYTATQLTILTIFPQNVHDTERAISKVPGNLSNVVEPPIAFKIFVQNAKSFELLETLFFVWRRWYWNDTGFQTLFLAKREILFVHRIHGRHINRLAENRKGVNSAGINAFNSSKVVYPRRYNDAEYKS